MKESPEHQFVFPGTFPIAVSPANQRASINRFNTNGRTTHSAQGATLWVILRYCHLNRVPFTLTVRRGLGYEVIKLEKL